VAVAGLPNPRKDHAVIMARFAVDCLGRFHKLVKMLERTLGPDTGELGIRMGMHSGQVVAGVLRGKEQVQVGILVALLYAPHKPYYISAGDKGRFQLFGDTVNLASRIESTGVCYTFVSIDFFIHLSHCFVLHCVLSHIT
jgi:class 3 adenylate cyclase